MICLDRGEVAPSSYCSLMGCDPPSTFKVDRHRQHHLGILRTVFNSTTFRTAERCSSCRSCFYALNAVGSYLSVSQMQLHLNIVCACVLDYTSVLHMSP